jgi:hypothetical protein
MIRRLDGLDSILRREFLDDLVHETKKTEGHISGYLKALHEAGLLTVTRGNEHSSRIHVSG